MFLVGPLILYVQQNLWQIKILGLAIYFTDSFFHSFQINLWTYHLFQTKAPDFWLEIPGGKKTPPFVSEILCSRFGGYQIKIDKI